MRSLRASLLVTAFATVIALVGSCGPTAGPAATPTEIPRSAFPPGAEGTTAWARACLPDGSMSILLTPDLAYISSPRPSFWWDSVASEETDLRLADGGSATEVRAKDASDLRIAALFTIRGQRWTVEGEKGDARFRPAVECVHRRLVTL